MTADPTWAGIGSARSGPRGCCGRGPGPAGARHQPCRSRSGVVRILDALRQWDRFVVMTLALPQVFGFLGHGVLRRVPSLFAPHVVVLLGLAANVDDLVASIDQNCGAERPLLTSGPAPRHNAVDGQAQITRWALAGGHVALAAVRQARGLSDVASTHFVERWSGHPHRPRESVVALGAGHLDPRARCALLIWSAARVHRHWHLCWWAYFDCDHRRRTPTRESAGTERALLARDAHKRTSTGLIMVVGIVPHAPASAVAVHDQPATWSRLSRPRSRVASPLPAFAHVGLRLRSAAAWVMNQRPPPSLSRSSPWQQLERTGDHHRPGR